MPPEEITVEQLKEAISGEVRKALDDELKRLGNMPHPNQNQDALLTPGATGEEEKNKLFSDELEKFPGPFPTFQKYLQTISYGGPLTKHLVRAEMEEGDPESGGYLVPEPMGELLWLDTLGASVIFGRCRRVKMKSSTQKFPRIIDTDHSTNLFDGLLFRFVAEKGSKTDTKPKVAEIELKARTLYAMTYVTNQLLQDSRPSAEKMLRKMYTNGSAWKMDEQIFRGTGAGSPLGILGSGGLITQAKESGQAASTIVWKNVVKMWSQLIPALQSQAVWYIHPSCTESIMDMNVTVGTGGGPVMVEAGAGVRPIPRQLLGAPIQWTEHCNYLGALGDIILAVPAAYVVGIRKGLTIDVSTHLRFDKNETAFRGEMRIDGQPQIDETLKLRDGTHIVSPFIVLEARE